MKRILILCTGNSCRSIMTEALFSHHGAGKVQAFSAGSKPTGFVNPVTLQVLRNWGLPTAGLESKSWDVYKDESFDIVITVCDKAASEPCPVHLKAAVRAHWGVEDPARVEGPPARVLPEHERVLGVLERRVKALLALPIETLTPESLTAELQTIGQS